MRIGIDFDNTIINYEYMFHDAAVRRGLIPAATPSDKTAVRDSLREAGLEDAWTELQGIVYGPEIGGAAPYNGVKSFIRNRVASGDDVFIVSHKTRYPYIGEKHDLHAAAAGWLEAQGFFNKDGVGLARKIAYFEITKDAKLARIGSLACDIFFDDLPEFLSEPGFPLGVRRVLFDPHGNHTAQTDMDRITSWTEAESNIVAWATSP